MHVWAASYNMLWNKVYASKDQAIVFGPRTKVRGKTLLKPGTLIYYPVEKVRTTRHLIQCRIRNPGVGGVETFTVDRPFVWKSSIEFFREKWESVRNGEKNIAAYTVGFRCLRVEYDETCQGGQRGNIVADLMITKFGDIEVSKIFDLVPDAANRTGVKTTAHDDKAMAKKNTSDASKANPSAGEAVPNDEAENQLGGDSDADAEPPEEDDDAGFGLELLTREYAACIGKPEAASMSPENIENAVRASMEEAMSSSLQSDGVFSESADSSMADVIAGLVDEDLTLMQSVEDNMIQKALEARTISQDDVAASISRISKGDPDPDNIEDAMVDALLNSAKLMGNEAQNPDEDSEDDAPQEPDPSSSSSARVPQQPNQPLLAVFLPAISDSLQALLDCLRALQAGQPGENLSIVQSPVDVQRTPSFGFSRRILMVHWEVPGKTGRVARVDESGKLVSMVCVGDNKNARNFESCKIIHPDIGLRMERVKKKDRQAVPNNVIRVVNMLLQLEDVTSREQEAAIRQHDSDLQWQGVLNLEDCCAYCQREKLDPGSQGDDHHQHDCFPKKCPLCLLPFHASCVSQLVETHPDDLLNATIQRSIPDPSASWQRSKQNKHTHTQIDTQTFYYVCNLFNPCLTDRRCNCKCVIVTITDHSHSQSDHGSSAMDHCNVTALVV